MQHHLHIHTPLKHCPNSWQSSKNLRSEVLSLKNFRQRHENSHKIKQKPMNIQGVADQKAKGK